MWLRRYKSIAFFLALLLVLSVGVSLPGRAEAQMRCAGASPHSAPCAQAELPVAGLTAGQVYGTLMSCCRSRRGGCPMMHNCPMQMHRGAITATHTPARVSSRSLLASRRCLVSIRVTAAAPATLAAPRTRWLLTASPALAPPVTTRSIALPARAVSLAFWTDSPVFSPHTVPSLHGLRAPPTV